MPTHSEQPEEPIWSLLPFWMVAFAAAALFAAVTIAPALEQGDLLTAGVCRLALQCRHLSEANDDLQRVIEAIKHDPEFTGELARCDLDYGMPDEQRLPAPLKHRKQPSKQPLEAFAKGSSSPILYLFAHDRLVREAALLTAAVFTIVGFTCFNRTRDSLAMKRGAGGPVCTTRNVRSGVPA